MDKFEQMVQAMAKMPPAELAKAVEAKKAACICPDCPTYTRCAKDAKELLYCAIGKSFMCISEEKNCICPSCPVTAEFGLKYKYFCTRQAEKAQRYEQAIWGTKMV
jgi:hypothetical protein